MISGSPSPAAARTGTPGPPALAGATALARRRYDRLAPIYDLLDGPMELEARIWRREQWAGVGAERVLEVGVGTGKSLRYQLLHFKQRHKATDGDYARTCNLTACAMHVSAARALDFLRNSRNGGALSHGREVSSSRSAPNFARSTQILRLSRASRSGPPPPRYKSRAASKAHSRTPTVLC
jgi:hypothetical protein